VIPGIVAGAPVEGGGGGTWEIADAVSLTAVESGYGGYTVRLRADEVRLLVGSKVRLTLDFTGQPYNILAAYCGIASPTGDPWDFAAPPEQVTFGGSPTASGSNAILDTDEIDVAIASGQDLLFAIAFAPSSNIRYQPRSGYDYYYIGGNDAAAETPSGTYTTGGTSYAAIVTVIEVLQP